MLDNEQRAEINHPNAQPSTGPRTKTGKQHNPRKSLSPGRRAQLLKNFVPPHSAVLCHQDRLLYFRAAEIFLAKYRPHDAAEEHLVLRIVSAEWRIDFLNRIASGFWNQEMIGEFEAQAAPIPEVAELLALLEATKNLAKDIAVDRFLHRATREQDRIIAAAERRLIRMRTHFPSESKSIERREFDAECRGFLESVSKPEEPATRPTQAANEPN